MFVLLRCRARPFSFRLSADAGIQSISYRPLRCSTWVFITCPLPMQRKDTDTAPSCSGFLAAKGQLQGRSELPSFLHSRTLCFRHMNAKKNPLIPARQTARQESRGVLYRLGMRSRRHRFSRRGIISGIFCCLFHGRKKDGSPKLQTLRPLSGPRNILTTPVPAGENHE